MKDLAVMYHYVREKNGWNGIVPLTPDTFLLQIDELTKHYDIVSLDNLEVKGSKPKCILTFDDATKDQYTIAFDLLKKKGLPAYFTVMSGPLEKGEIPVFHLVHTVLSLYSDEEIWEDLKSTFTFEAINQSQNYYHYETNKIRRFIKYVLNFLLTEYESKAFLEKKVLAKYTSKEAFIQEFYLSKQELQTMKEEGMTIGVHCVNHRPYSGEAIAFYEAEIEPCARFIEKELGFSPEWYTPAFGGGEKYKEMIEDLEPILIQNGYKGGFTTVQGTNEGLSSFWLYRYDCIDLPPVKTIEIKHLM